MFKKALVLGAITLGIAGIATACSNSSGGSGTGGTGGSATGGSGGTATGGSGGTATGGSGGTATGGSGGTATGGAGGASAAGTCKHFCCSDSDCNGGHCTAFDTTNIGTLGSCDSMGGAGGASNTDAGSAGSGTDAGSAGSGGASAGDAGVTLPTGCVKAGAGITKVDCNPVTNEGCNTASGEACDLGDNGNGGTDITCFPAPNTQKLGETCDNANGPFCEGTLTCK